MKRTISSIEGPSDVTQAEGAVNIEKYSWEVKGRTITFKGIESKTTTEEFLSMFVKAFLEEGKKDIVQIVLEPADREKKIYQSDSQATFIRAVDLYRRLYGTFEGVDLKAYIEGAKRLGAGDYDNYVKALKHFTKGGEPLTGTPEHYSGVVVKYDEKKKPVAAYIKGEDGEQIPMPWNVEVVVLFCQDGKVFVSLMASDMSNFTPAAPGSLTTECMGNTVTAKILSAHGYKEAYAPEGPLHLPKTALPLALGDKLILDAPVDWDKKIDAAIEKTRELNKEIDTKEYEDVKKQEEGGEKLLACARFIKTLDHFRHSTFTDERAKINKWNRILLVNVVLHPAFRTDNKFQKVVGNLAVLNKKFFDALFKGSKLNLEDINARFFGEERGPMTGYLALATFCALSGTRSNKAVRELVTDISKPHEGYADFTTEYSKHKLVVFFTEEAIYGGFPDTTWGHCYKLLVARSYFATNGDKDAWYDMAWVMGKDGNPKGHGLLGTGYHMAGALLQEVEEGTFSEDIHALCRIPKGRSVRKSDGTIDEEMYIRAMQSLWEYYERSIFLDFMEEAEYKALLETVGEDLKPVEEDNECAGMPGRSRVAPAATILLT